MVRTKSKSLIWKFFVKRDNSIFVRCNICHLDYKSSGNTTNLFDHIKRKHPHEWSTLRDVQRDEEGSTSSVSVENQENEHQNVDEEVPRKIKKRNTLKDYFNRDKKYSDNDRRKKRIDHAIVNMVACDFQPFNIVENKGFKNLLLTLDSQYDLPSRGNLKEKLVPHVYEKLNNQLKSALSEVKYISITSDAWTSPSNEGIITVTCHFIKDSMLRSAVLKTTQLIGSHTGIHISEAIENILIDWNLRNKVVAMLSDNGSNIVQAASLLKIRHIPCFAHVLNLLVHDILKNNNLNSILRRCKDIVSHFRHSTLSADKLKQKQKEANVKELKLLQETPTRWNSTFFMIKRILEIRQPLTLAISECEKAPASLNSRETSIIEDLCKILDPFDKATKEISGDKYVTISLIIPLIKGIAINLQSVKEKLKTDEGIEILNDCFLRVQTRLYPYETRTPLLLATLLDPRVKNMLLGKLNMQIMLLSY